MSIFMFGDFHNNARNEKVFLQIDEFPEQVNLTSDDTMIITGDVGIIGGKYREENRNWIASQNYTTLCVMGNHEQWNDYFELSIEIKFGGKIRVLKTSSKDIYFTITGEVYTIEGKTFLSINGALSIDKERLVDGISWFKEETISNNEIDIVLDKINEINGKVDYLLTHTVSSDILLYFTQFDTTFNNTLKYKCHTSEFLSYVDEILDYKECLFGHFHIQKSITIKGKTYSCFYMTKPKLLVDSIKILENKTLIL